MASDRSMLLSLFRARLERLRKQVNLGSYLIYLLTLHVTLHKVLNLPKTLGMRITINFFTAQVFSKDGHCMKTCTRHWVYYNK